MKKTHILFLIVIIIVGCKNNNQSNERELVIASLNIWKPDTLNAYTSVEILSAYRIYESCTSSINYSNLYVCRTRLTSKIDTVYIMDACSKPLRSLEQKGVNVETGFYASDIILIHPKVTIISVPDSFHIPPNSKCLFVNLVNTFEL